MKIEKITYDDLTNLLKSRTAHIKADYIIKILPEIRNSGYLREMINTLRVNGNPIVSSSDGYKWSTDKEEILSCYKSLMSRAKFIENAAIGMVKSIYNQEIIIIEEIDEFWLTN